MTDMNTQSMMMLEYIGSLKFSLLPELLPMGREDKTQIILGSAINNSRQKSVLKINVWRDETNVFYQNKKKAIFYKPIIAESDPVDMEDAMSAGPFTLSATGGAGEKWPRCLGDFILTKKQHYGRPVYRNSNDKHLWSQEDGTWAVSYTVGHSLPGMRSTTAAVSPDLCQHWQYVDVIVSDKDRQYVDGDWKFKPGDITVTISGSHSAK